jgi:hypothetical protein
VTGFLTLGGMLDELRIYDKALTLAEVRSLYENPAGSAVGMITAEKIVADAVTATKIAADAVLARNIKAGEIDATHIAAGSITADKIDVEDLATDTAFIGDLYVKNLDAAAGSFGGLSSESLYSGEMVFTGTDTYGDVYDWLAGLGVITGNIAHIVIGTYYIPSTTYTPLSIIRNGTDITIYLLSAASDAFSSGDTTQLSTKILTFTNVFAPIYLGSSIVPVDNLSYANVNIGAASLPISNIYAGIYRDSNGDIVVQTRQDAVADASETVASVKTQLNSLLAKLRTHGLIDT